MQSVNCEVIHSGRLQTTDAKAFAEQLITERVIEKIRQLSELVMYVTTVIRTSIFLLTHPHLASADFVRLLPIATSADLCIRLLHIASVDQLASQTYQIGRHWIASQQVL